MPHVSFFLTTLSVIAIVGATPAAAQLDPDWRLCEGGPGVRAFKESGVRAFDESILACTRILARGDRETAFNRGKAYDHRGNWYLRKGDVDRAIAEYTEAMSLGEFPFFHFLYRCEAYAIKSDFDRAIADCSEALRAVPEDWRALERRGKLYFITGNYAAAASDLHSKSSVETLNAAIWLYLAQRRAEDPRALDELEANAALLKRHLGFEFIQLFLGRAQLEETHGARINPCESSFYSGEWYLLNGRELEAEHELQQAVATCSGQPIPYEYLAASAELPRIKRVVQDRVEPLRRRNQEKSERAAEFEQLVQAQTRIIESRSDQPARNRAAAYNLRGGAYLENDDLERAIADYSKAISLDSTQVEAFKNRCTAHAIKGDIDAAIADCTAAIGLDPDQTQSSLRRGQLQFIAGNYTAAASDLSRAVEQEPHDIFALIWLDLANQRSWRPSNFSTAAFNLSLSVCQAASSPQDLHKCLHNPSAEWPWPLLTGSSVDRTHFCEQQFYLGERYILGGQGRPAAFAALKKATAIGCPRSTYEFLAAQAELKRLDKVLQERSAEMERRVQQGKDQIAQFEQLMQTTRNEASPIVFEYNYKNGAWGYANLGCFVSTTGKVYVYDFRKTPAVSVASSVDNGDYARAVEMAKAVSNQKLDRKFAAFDAGDSVWTASVGGVITVLKVAGVSAGELPDPKAIELVKLIGNWCPSAAAAVDFEKRKSEFHKNAVCAQPDPKVPIQICQ
jgi:tetratricopeptide (TPR) repeat protein